jgi:hypothetical protein
MPTRSADAAQTIRDWIARGRWPPGKRVPTKLELCKRFGISNVTMQIALSRLSAEGFLVARGRAGTFVTDSPPCMRRIAVTFPVEKGQSRWYDLLEAGARSLTLASYDIVPYFGCGSLEAAMPTPAFARFSEDVSTHRLAGAVLCNPPSENTPALLKRSKRMKYVSIGMAVAELPVVDLGDPNVRVLTYLVARKRKRLAILSTLNFGDAFTSRVRREATKLGLMVKDCWIHHLDTERTGPVESLVRLILDYPPQDRPDAIYVMDDHLGGQAAAGLRASGVSVPDDLDVICHSNFPEVPMPGIAATYVGVDTRDVMGRCVDTVIRQLEGGTVAARTIIDPMIVPPERPL